MASTEKEALSECCICLTTYTDPRMLPCFHTACLKCFEDIQLKSEKKPGDFVPCTLCRIELIKPIDEYPRSEESKKEFRSCAFVIVNCDAGVRMSLNRPDDVTAIEPLPEITFQSGGTAAAAVYRNSIFVCGLGSEIEDIWRFDASSSKWSKCASLIQGRKYHSVAFVDHVLYICGGMSNSFPWKVLDDVETYDTFGDRCSKVGKLAYAVSGSGNCVLVKASLYMFGGLGSYTDKGMNAQVYDTTLNTCTVINLPMPRPLRERYWFRGELWENFVILLGKYGCFTYNFDTETWKVIDKFRLENFLSGMIINDGKLFEIGCGANKDDIKWIPVANILNDELIEWKHYAKLPDNYFEKTFAFVKLECPE